MARRLKSETILKQLYPPPALPLFSIMRKEERREDSVTLQGLLSPSVLFPVDLSCQHHHRSGGDILSPLLCGMVPSHICRSLVCVPVCLFVPAHTWAPRRPRLASGVAAAHPQPRHSELCLLSEREG